MAFYLIGLGLSEKSVTIESLEVLKKCERIYLENYTVNFPYSIKNLEKFLNIKIVPLSRKEIEGEKILGNAKEKNIALLVYGDALSATTHLQLVISCRKQKIPFNILHNSSILTAIAESGLSLYKVGKIASMPNWNEHTNKPTSFVGYIKENLSIKAHTLILIDIGLEFKSALAQLKQASEKENLEINQKIIVLSKTGNSNQEIFYDSLENLKDKKVEMPYCIVIPSKLHFLEKESLELFSS